MGSSSANPGQGYDQLHLDTDSTPPPSPGLDLDSSPTTSTTPLSRPVSLAPAAAERRDGYYANVGSGSPPKRQSPLRQSISYTDSFGSPEQSFATPSPRSSLGIRHSRSRSEIPDIASTGSRAAGTTLGTSLDWNPRRSCTFGDLENRRGSVIYETSPKSNNLTPLNRSKAASPIGGSPFSFFTSRMPSIKGLAASPIVVPQNDELINLDVETALFPNGTPSEGEAFSPAAFMNLQMTATGLLKKFQAAYQIQAITIRELEAEREAQDDEKAEAETRTRHLRMQLEDMARKASETEAVMQALMEELNKEKRLRIEEKTAREKLMSQSEGSFSEDLGVEDDQRRRAWRRSGETAKSDFSFETDEDSIEEASVFSRPRSPALTAPSISEASILDHPITAPPSRSSTFGQTKPARQSQPQMTTFQKIFKGISGDPTKDGGTNGCRNCQGQDASIAWDTVSLLKIENKGLKQRVTELEDVVEQALDVVNGVGQ